MNKHMYYISFWDQPAADLSFLLFPTRLDISLCTLQEYDACNNPFITTLNIYIGTIAIPIIIAINNFNFMIDIQQNLDFRLSVSIYSQTTNNKLKSNKLTNKCYRLFVCTYLLQYTNNPSSIVSLTRVPNNICIFIICTYSFNLRMIK